MIDLWLNIGSVMTSRPGQLILGYGERTWLTQPSRSSTTFYFPDFFLSDKTPWFTHTHTLEIATQELIDLLQTKTQPLNPLTSWENSCRDLFEEQFSNLMYALKTDTLTKAVPYAFEVTEEKMTRDRLQHSLLSTLKYAQEKPVFLYGFWDATEGVLGATPEMLFTLDEENQNVETIACGGTRANLSDLNLESDPKELHEHQVIIEGIRESLAPFGEVKTGKLELLQLPALTHLITPIRVRLNKTAPFNQLVEALHPTPALGAFPKTSGWQWLLNYQTRLPRRRYGAPVGYSHSNGADVKCGVAIRNMQWDTHGIRIGAGCGVVKESQLENEWQEILLKIRAVKGILAI